MHICYLDESGDTIMFPSSNSQISPVLVLAGVVIDRTNLHPLTLDFLDLKEKFFPNLMAGARPLNRILIEVKGSDVRKTIRRGNRNQRRHQIGFIDKFLELLESYETKIIARILIKEPDQPIGEVKVYTSYVQAICTCFQALLEEQDDHGIIIADSRLPHQNSQVSHSIFTQKFRLAGDQHGRILEMPTFGHSHNHAGIQIADLLASAILFPIASVTYCRGHIISVHVSNNFSGIKTRYGERLKQLQYRYEDSTGRWRGGITVSDTIGHRSSAIMFRN